MGWEPGEQVPGLGAYADWELADIRPKLRDTIVFPVFVQLNLGGSIGSAIEVIEQVIALHGPTYVPDYEIDILRTVSDRLIKSGAETGAQDIPEVLTMVYCKFPHVRKTLWTVLYVGSPVHQVKTFPDHYPGKPFSLRSDQINENPLVAIIDDGIGFLNARFRATPQQTRFDGVWVQGPNQPVDLAVPPPGNNTYSGTIYEAADIDAELATGEEEAAIYHRLNETLLRPTGHKSTNFRAGHGTHVLDLAAGANPGEPESGIRLLAVQLPPAAVAATSGRRLEHYVVQGLRWIISRALIAVSAPGNNFAGVPLIVNLSIGSLAGPKDGTGFLEKWIPKEIANFHALSADTPIRIVAAYGNARRERLVAKSNLRRQDPVSFNWCILPDDRTASYLEIRVDKSQGANITMTLAPPMGVPATVLPRMLTAMEKLSYARGGDLVTGVYALPEANFDTMLIAAAPTTRDDPGATSPAGAWRITLTNTGSDVVKMVARVQRDDTPAGYRLKGRQSWLDHQDGWLWDYETLDWSLPDPSCPITRHGTEVSYSGMASASVLFVAAATPDPTVPNGFRPSNYSAEGDPDVQGAPTLAAFADDGKVLSGLRAAGVISGSSDRMSGTSVAAPKVVRALMTAMMSGTRFPPYKGGLQPHGEDVALILSVPFPGGLTDPPDSRTGAGILAP